MYCEDYHGDIKQPNHNKQHEEYTNQLVRTRTMMTTMNSLLANQVWGREKDKYF